MGEQRLDITVPQAWLIEGYDGYVEPSLWEDGIPAALLSYSANGYHSTNGSADNDSMYAAFNTGINLGAWRFRANGNYNWTKDSGSSFDYQNRYLQRDLPSMRSQLVVGETYTTGETFDSVSIRGARLYSDNRMLPSQLANYAPIIRGVANSNAKVSITRGGYKIYESTVPPAPLKSATSVLPATVATSSSPLRRPTAVNAPLASHSPRLCRCSARASDVGISAPVK